MEEVLEVEGDRVHLLSGDVGDSTQDGRVLRQVGERRLGLLTPFRVRRVALLDLARGHIHRHHLLTFTPLRLSPPQHRRLELLAWSTLIDDASWRPSLVLARHSATRRAPPRRERNEGAARVPLALLQLGVLIRHCIHTTFDVVQRQEVRHDYNLRLEVSLHHHAARDE